MNISRSICQRQAIGNFVRTWSLGLRGKVRLSLIELKKSKQNTFRWKKYLDPFPLLSFWRAISVCCNILRYVSAHKSFIRTSFLININRRNLICYSSAAAFFSTTEYISLTTSSVLLRSTIVARLIAKPRILSYVLYLFLP